MVAASNSSATHPDALVKIEIEGTVFDLPRHWICPITCDIFSAPMMTKSGLRYERSAIIDWLRISDGTCPLTRESMSLSDLIPDRQLQYSIENWKVANGISLTCKRKTKHLGSDANVSADRDAPFAVFRTSNPTNVASLKRSAMQGQMKTSRTFFTFLFRHST